MLKYPFIPTSYQNRKSVSTVDDGAKEYIADRYFASGYNQEYFTQPRSISMTPYTTQSTSLLRPSPVIKSPQLNNVYQYLTSRKGKKTNLTINSTPTLTVRESGSLHPSIILIILIFSCMVAGALVGSQLLQMCCPDLIKDFSNSINRDNIRDVNRDGDRDGDIGFST